MNKEPCFQPLSMYRRLGDPEMTARAREILDNLRRRRTVRDFSDEPVDRRIIEDCLLAAGTAPNGANLQPWHFAVVGSPEIKNRIRLAAEGEEREFYGRRATPQWLNALAPFGTGPEKPFLEIAPWLIVVFARTKDLHPDGSVGNTYYANESTGIATGMLITALHLAGLVTLTHTPSPMKFLNQILGRPSTERPFVLLVAGFPASGAQVPVISKKTLEEISSFH